VIVAALRDSSALDSSDEETSSNFTKVSNNKLIVVIMSTPEKALSREVVHVVIRGYMRL